ncbi:titin [Drosophila innubila]|uniref:titin n=1 Tax=Drosophila innubila TaxID=198719 RepID=UPI00148BC624|nr:titin [Drosophila innubila]
MSLDGAHLNFVNASGVSEEHAAKGREFIVGSKLSCDLVVPEAERVHCEIKCDAFGRVTIYNLSDNKPILLNDQVVHSKRPLLHGARIKILNEVYTWQFPKSDELGTPDRIPPEQAANSSPSLKVHRQRRQFDNRLTVHNFRYSINSDDEGNTSIESRELDTSTSSNTAETSATAEPDRSITPPCKDADETMPKVDLLEATQNKENTSTLGNKLMLQLCARSDVVITSFSPRETGVKIEKSFTCVMKPTTGMGMSSTATTPKSVYNTPKSVLSELNDESCSRDLMDFSTPSTSQKSLAGKRPTSMYLVDLTTPQRLRPQLSVTPKQTPGSAGIISANSTAGSSDASVIVIDITNSSTPSTTPAKKQQRTILNTPKDQLLAEGSTPKRTPQSLMKRALLTSAKKQISANTRTPTTPLESTNRQSLLDARRQCLTAPRRLPFHPHPQWRTPGRRQAPAIAVTAPQTSPRKRQSVSLSSPRDNKISKMRKTLAANAKISPNVGMSNKLVAKARRALNSPKQESPKACRTPYSPKHETPNRIGSPKESSTPDRADLSKAELSLTFTIDDEQSATGPALEALINEEDEANASEKPFLESVNAIESKLNESSAKDSTKASPKDVETCEESSKDVGNSNEECDEDTLNKTYDLNVSSTKSNLESSTADVEQLLNSKVADESLDIDTNTAADEENSSSNDKSSIQLEKSDQNLATVDIIDDSICEEVPTTSTHQQDMATITDVHLAEDTICEEVPANKEDTSIPNANADCEDQDEEEAVAPPGETPIPRRSSRRISITQDAVSLTPRRSVRRASIDAKNKLEQCIKPTRRASCSAVVESQPNTAVLATPKRKRRLTEELSTPTRKSQRLLCNTPKRALQVDESVGDMGVIIEEDALSADKFLTVTDEDYGAELPIKDTDEPDKIDYQGMRELLKTPKSCSTPHFKGLREMVRTPKVHPSPMLGNIEELLETPSSDASTPKRSVTVSRVTLELSKSDVTTDAQDLYFKTPRGKNLMVPNDPASAVLKSMDKSLATTTEYDLNATNATLPLDKIFDDVLAAEATDPAITVEDSENEINVTAISTAAVSELDPLSTSATQPTETSDTVRSEVLMNMCYADTSHKDPLTSTAFKKGSELDLHRDALNDESYAEGPKSPGLCDVSGIQMLDRTTDSMFSEPLVVTGVDSCDVTLEETKPTGMVNKTSKNDVLEEGSDTDSMVGLSEPLILSDDEADVEEVELDSQEPIKKSNSNDSSISEYKNKEEDKNREDAAQTSSVIESDLNEEETIDLTEDKNNLESTLNTEAIADNTSCSEIESQLESEIAIDLGSSCSESSAQTEVTRTSMIYGADSSQTNVLSETETRPTDESLIRVSSNILDKDTTEGDSVIELDASNTDTICLDDESVTNKSTASVIADDKNEDKEITVATEELPDQVNAIQSEEEEVQDATSVEMSAKQSTEHFQATNKDEDQLEVPGPKHDETDIEINTANDVHATKLLLNDTKQDNEKSDKIQIDEKVLSKDDVAEDIHVAENTETQVVTTNTEESEIDMQSSDVAETKAEDTSPEIPVENESLIDGNTSVQENVAISADLTSIQNESVQSIKSMDEGLEIKAESETKTSENGEATIEKSQVVDETENVSEVAVNSEASKEANDLLPEVVPIPSEELSSENKKATADVEVSSESLIESNVEAEMAEEQVASQTEIEINTQVDRETTNSDEPFVEINASVVAGTQDEQEQPDKQLYQNLSTSSEKQSIEPDDEIKSANLEATNIDDSLVELNADNTENRLETAAQTLPTSPDVPSNQDKIEDETEDDLGSANADKSSIEMEASVVAESKNDEEQLDIPAAQTLSKSAEVPSIKDLIEDETEADLGLTNADESLVEIETSTVAEHEEKHHDEEAAETLSTTSEFPSNQDKIEDKTEADSESTSADESLVKMNAPPAFETEKEEARLDEAAETLSTSDVTSNLNNIENETEADLASTNADESLVEMKATVVAASKNDEEHLDKPAAETLSTSAVVTSNQQNMEHKTQTDVESKLGATDKTEEQAADILSTSAQPEIDDKTLDEGVIDLDAETDKEDKKLEEAAAETLSSQDKMEAKVESKLQTTSVSNTEKTEEQATDILSTPAEECLVEASAQPVIDYKTLDDGVINLDTESDKEGEQLEEAAAETLSTFTEVPSSQDEMEAEVESKLQIIDVPKTENTEEQTADILSTSAEKCSVKASTQPDIDSKTLDESVIDLVAETVKEEEQLDERLSEIILKSEKSIESNDKSKAQTDVKVTNENDSLVELDASSDKKDQHQNAAEIPSTYSAKSSSEALDKCKAQAEVDTINVVDSLVKMDVLVEAENEKINDELDVPQTLFKTAENVSENKAQVDLKSTTTNNSLIVQTASGVAEANKILDEFDKRDCAPTSADISAINIKSPKANDVEPADKNSSLITDTKEIPMDENEVKNAEQHNDSKDASDVMEPPAQSQEPESVKESDLNASIVNNEDLYEQDVVSEPLMTEVVKTTSENETVLNEESSSEVVQEKTLQIEEVEATTSNIVESVIEQQTPSESTTFEEVLVRAEGEIGSESKKPASYEAVQKDKESPEVSRQIEGSEAVIRLQSVEDNIKDENLALNTDSQQAASVNKLETSKEAQQVDSHDKSDQTEAPRTPEENTKSTQIVEPSIQIIESEVEDENPEKKSQEDAEQNSSKHVEIQNATDKKEVPAESIKTEDMVVDLITSDEESSSHASDKACLEKIDKVESSTTNITKDQTSADKIDSESDSKAIVEENNIKSECPESEKETKAEQSSVKSIDELPKKGRGRKPSTLDNLDTEFSEMKPTKRTTRKASVALEVKETHIQIKEEKLNNERVQLEVEEKQNLDKPKVSRRKSMHEVVEAKEEKEIEEKIVPAEICSEKPKRRGRKPTAEVVEIEVHAEEKLELPIDLDKPKQQAQKPIAEEEKREETIDLDKPKRRVRKPAGKVVETEENVEKTVELEKPKRRGRKPSAEVVETEVHVDEHSKQIDDSDKSKRRGRGKHAAEIVETEAHVNETKEETIELDRPKRRVQGHVESPTHVEEEMDKAVDLEKPKRRGRNPSAEVVETEEKLRQIDESDKPKRRLRKPSAEVVVEEKREETVEPKRRARKPSADVAKTEEHAEKNIEETADQDKPKRRGQKSSADVPLAEPQDDSELTTHTTEVVEEFKEKPKLRNRKASESGQTSKEHLAVIDEAGEPEQKKPRLEETVKFDAAHNVRRRGRKQSVSAEITQKQEPLAESESAEALQKEELPQEVVDASACGEKVSTRRGRKATIDEEAPIIVEASASREKVSTRRGRKATIDEEAPIIVEASGSREKVSTRRGRKATVDEEAPIIVEASASREKVSTRRGRKATIDEEAPTAQPAETAEHKPNQRARKESADVVHAESEPLEATDKSTRRARKPSADVAAETEPPAEKRNTRRVRKPSANIEITVEEAPQPKKTTARRGRKASASTPADETEKQFDVQTLPTHPIDAATVASVMISPKPQVHSSEDELTPRRREGRNLPRKNYDETSDEDKLGSSSRKARKPAANKAAATPTAKPAETETLPLPKPSTPVPTKQKPSVEVAVEAVVEPVVAPSTPVVTIALPDPTSSQKREGRNMPRKNYNETSDDEKPSTSRGRRVRQPTIKALELLVDTAARPLTPKRRAGKAKAAESTDDHSEEPPEKKITVEESIPVPAKARGATRRKAHEVDDVTEAEPAAPTPVKRGARSRKESANSQADEPDVEVEQKPPAKRNARGANTRKAKIVADEVTDEQPASKKPRGGARAKTPVVVEVEKVHEDEEPKEVPATKRATPARGRAARAVKVADESETVQVTAPPSRTGRGRKVHFETTEEGVTATKEDQPAAAEAPKRATRSRRK